MIRLWLDKRIRPYRGSIMFSDGFVRLSNVLWFAYSYHDLYDIKIEVNFLDQGRGFTI